MKEWGQRLMDAVGFAYIQHTRVEINIHDNNIIHLYCCIHQWQYIVSEYGDYTIKSINTGGQFHKAEIIAYQKYLLSTFYWLPAKLWHKMSALWLVVCFITLSENVCLAKFSAEQLYEIGPLFGWRTVIQSKSKYWQDILYILIHWLKGQYHHDQQGMESEG